VEIKNQTKSKPKLLVQVREYMRTLHYSKRTQESYINWIKRFIIFHNKTHPEKLGKDEIRLFLNYLAVERNVSASTQNQALQGILFLYKQILHKDVGWIDDIKRPSTPKHIPVVFTKTEAHSIIEQMEGIPKIVTSLLYGSGLRLSEALRLRIKDVDFGFKQLIVRDGKGEKDRITVLPEKLTEELRTHINKVRNLHKKDNIKKNISGYICTQALSRKYLRQRLENQELQSKLHHIL